MAETQASRLSRHVVEALLALTVAGIVALLAGPYLYRLWRRERLRGAAQKIYTLVVAERLKAISTNQQVVMWIDPKARQVVAWGDLPPYNFVQDAGETTVLEFRIPSGVFFRYAP